MFAPHETIELSNALRALAIMGDLSMGQPIDHSQRVAALSTAMATQLGWGSESVNHAQEIALLRWSGCTANAAEFAATIRDDVGGRALMLQLQIDEIEFLVPPEAIAEKVGLVSTIHCDVSSLIANLLGLDKAVSTALGCVFEHWDGSGNPNALQGDAMPEAAMVVAVCSELEILSRMHGLPKALTILRERADAIYPAYLVDIAETHAQRWLDEIQSAHNLIFHSENQRSIRMDLLGHVIDLKLPWLLGHSSAVAKLVQALATTMGIAKEKQVRLRRAAWLHGLGRVSVPNAIWDRKGPLSIGDMERVRLVPYWTSRVGNTVVGLKDAAETAAHAFERLDGSGYFRGMVAASTPTESRILATALCWTAMTSDRPWRKAMTQDEAIEELRRETNSGRYDTQVFESLVRCVAPNTLRVEAKGTLTPILTVRELDVLRRVSFGDSNKEAAKQLGISPSTVRTHLESIFKKLDCKTRAACTLRASMMGILEPH